MKIETILFLDGSNLSIYLLNYIIKIKKFEVKYLILSSNCKKKIIERLKKKFKVLTSNLKNPKIIGFGISDKKSFNEACKYSNGAIIGTNFIKYYQLYGR